MMDTPQLTTTRHTAAYWRVTFDTVPMDVVDTRTITALDNVLSQLENDSDVRVVVFDSANPRFHRCRHDLRTQETAVRTRAEDSSGVAMWPEILARLGRMPVATIASMRGHTGGAALPLACDLRFASNEQARNHHGERHAGSVEPPDAATAFQQLMGRSRAFEVLFGADHFGGEVAERYGCVYRTFPDHELPMFVDAFARRLAGFSKAHIAETKAFVNQGNPAFAGPACSTLPAHPIPEVNLQSPGPSFAIEPRELQLLCCAELRMQHHVAEYVLYL